MSAQLMSHRSQESSPSTSKSPYDSGNNYFGTASAGVASGSGSGSGGIAHSGSTGTSTGSKGHSLSRKSSGRAVPSFIITDTATPGLKHHGDSTKDATAGKNDQTVPRGATMSCADLPTPPRVTSPTFFNMKKHLIHNYQLPDEVGQVVNTDLDAEFLTNTNTVVIDVRPYTSYLHARLCNSLNVCVPTTLLKRKTFTMKNIIGSMQKFQQDYINQKISGNDSLKFVLYDDASTQNSCSFHLYQTCLKILDFVHQDRAAPLDWSISILSHGISSVNSPNDGILDYSHDPVLSPLSPTFPDDLSLRVSPSSIKTDSSFVTSPQTSAIPSASLCGFSLPSASDFSASFAASIKKNRGGADLHCHSDRDVINQPANNKLNPDLVPNWLRPFLEPASGFKAIADRFNKIEDIECLRLENVAKLKIPGADCNDSHCCSTEGDCSPSAPCPSCDQISYTLPEGIEYGNKNRYSNIWPYEHSRVKVLNSPAACNNQNKQLPESGDYFNANYVTVPRISKNRYIATQAPLPSTLNDFWRAVWYNKVKVIICLTNLSENGLKKSDNYWQDFVYESGIEVKLVDEETARDSNTTVRTLKVTKKSGVSRITEAKMVKQIEYKDWPDFGVPPSPASLVNLIDLKNSAVRDESAPIVVHCSAGCGRTGTFITIDVLLQMYWKTLQQQQSTSSSSVGTPLGRAGSIRSPFGQLNRQLLPKDKADDGVSQKLALKNFKFWGDDDLVYKTVNILRRQRLSMVQTLNQYVLCYETLLMVLNDSCTEDHLS